MRRAQPVTIPGFPTVLEAQDSLLLEKGESHVGYRSELLAPEEDRFKQAVDGAA